MAYRWKNTVEAIQLPGDLPDMRPDTRKWAKGSWLVFEDGMFSRCCSDEEFQSQVEPIPRARKKKDSPAIEKPKRGRPRGKRVPPAPPRLEADGAVGKHVLLPPLDLGGIVK